MNMETFKLKIESTECLNKENVMIIININWTLIGDDSVNTYTVCGTQTIDEPDLERFIPFDDIKYDDLETWLLSYIDLESIKESISEQLKTIKPSLELITIPVI